MRGLCADEGLCTLAGSRYLNIGVDRPAAARSGLSVEAPDQGAGGLQIPLDEKLEGLAASH